MAGDQVRPLCTICGGRYCTELMAKIYLGGGKLLEGLAAINVSPSDLERMTKDDGNVLCNHYQPIYIFTCYDDDGTVCQAELYTKDEVVPLYESCDVIRAKNSKQS